VDFDAPEIRNITSYKGKTVDHRPVPLTPRLAAALLDLREKPGIATFKTGRKTGVKPDKSLVFGIQKTLQTSWEAARLDANLPHIRLHDLVRVGEEVSSPGMAARAGKDCRRSKLESTQTSKICPFRTQ